MKYKKSTEGVGQMSALGKDPAYGYKAIDNCPGGEEGHLDHLDLNGECPWCGAITQELAKLLEEPENN